MARRHAAGTSRVYKIIEGRSIPEAEARAILVDYTISLGWTNAEVVSLVLEPCLHGGSHWNGIVRPIGPYVRPERYERRTQWLEGRRYRR